MKIYTLIILLYLITVTLSLIKSDKSNRDSNQCTSKKTCSECITANPQCGWCMKKGNFSHDRCNFVHRLAEYRCYDHIFSPMPSFITIVDKELSKRIADNGDPIQMKPQRVHLRIRPNIPYVMNVQFNQAIGYPVDLYSESTSAVQLKDNATNNVKITYFSSCFNQKKIKTNICRGLRVGDTVNFETHITIISCPQNPKEWNQTILIYPVGLNVSLIIDLEMVCECDCEKSWNKQIDSEFCKGRGSYDCGVCACYGHYYGSRCECDAMESNPAEEEQSCIRGNDAKVCSGRGVCRCGECECYKRGAPEEVSGKYCECDNFNCDRYNGKVCSGSDHGKCVCGVCMCNDDWTQPDCSCRKSNINCVDPRTNRECNGRGKCVCGVCICEPSGDEQYDGQYCEDCPTCKSLCEKYKECVQCHIHQSGPLDEEACHNCSVIPIGTSEFEPQEGEQLCVFIDDDDCKFQFKYKYDLNEEITYVIAQNVRYCSNGYVWPRNSFDVLAIFIGVMVAIVLIGLVLILIWKLFL